VFVWVDCVLRGDCRSGHGPEIGPSLLLSSHALSTEPAHAVTAHRLTTRPVSSTNAKHNLQHTSTRLQSLAMAFNLSALRTSLPSASTSSARSFSSSAISRSAYPFSSTATIIPAAPAAPKTTSLLRTLNGHLNSQTPNGHLHSTLFSRRHPERLLPGSVVTISTYSTPPTAANPTPSSSSFSGVLIALRRRHAGRDTSIRLRNLVGRTGVEVSYKVSSPMIKEIKVVSRATTSGAEVVDKQGRVSRRKPALRAEKRAKLYFVRDQPDRKYCNL
jgi:large subunit ribosomal protein L19